MFFKKRKGINEVKTELISVLEKLNKLLEVCNFRTQADVVNCLLIFLEQNKIEAFKKRIRSVDMWGGSGAVWEILIQDEKMMEEFDAEIIKLINIMDLLGWRSFRMKRVRNLLRENS